MPPNLSHESSAKGISRIRQSCAYGVVYQCIGLRMERDREPAIQGMHVNVNECAALHRKWIRQTKYSDRGPASNCRRVVVPATFTPQIVPTHQRRFTGFDDKILSLYARGMTTREIQGHLEEIYGVEVSPSLISARHRGGDRGSEGVADAALWSRCIAILFLDALMVKMRHEGRVENRAVYVADRHRCWKATRTFLGCGPAPTKEPSSGCRCSRI